MYNILSNDAVKGNITMKAFDNKAYELEAKEKWGKTEAYRESSAKTAGYFKDKWNDVLGGMNDIFAQFASCKKSGESADSESAINLAKKLQDYISTNFYNCTKEILLGLSQMYVCDERFKNNIDTSGEGTAEFVSDAIKHYCKK